MRGYMSRVAMALCLLMLLMSLVDWGCLQDIFHDYLSPKALDEQTSLAVESVPGWTRTEGEWSWVTTTLYLRMALLTLTTAALWLDIRSVGRR